MTFHQISKSILLSIFLLCLGVGFAFPQKQKNKKTSTIKKSVIKPRTAVQVNPIYNYLTESFDTNLDKLPPNFKGHDFWAIVESLEKRTSTLTKGEFETTLENNKRVDAENLKPILGSATINSKFAILGNLQNKDNLFEQIRPSYNADAGIMTYTFIPSPVFFHSIGTFESIEEKKLFNDMKCFNYLNSKDFSRREYKMQISANKIVTVKELISGYSCLYLQNWGDKSILTFDEMRLEIKLPIEKAILAKTQSQVLFVGKIVNPFIIKSIKNTPPTSEEPYDLTSLRYSLHFDLLEIWIFNEQTGEIYLKKEFESKKQKNKESPITNNDRSEVKKNDESNNKINESLNLVIRDAPLSPNPKKTDSNEAVLDKPIQRTSQYYFIGGNVVSGGRKDYIKGLTLTQTILESGGLKKSNIRKVIIRRKNINGLLVPTEFDLKAIKDGKAADPMIEAGDTIEVGN